VHTLQSPCTSSLLRWNTLQSPFLPSSLVLDTHSPLVCLSIAPLYGLRHSPASCRLPPSRHSGQTPNRPSRTLRSTDRNNASVTVGHLASTPHKLPPLLSTMLYEYSFTTYLHQSLPRHHHPLQPAIPSKPPNALLFGGEGGITFFLLTPV
jgi:hypothetical protein